MDTSGNAKWRASKWIATSICLLVLGAWVASTTWGLAIYGDDTTVICQMGFVQIGHGGPLHEKLRLSRVRNPGSLNRRISIQSIPAMLRMNDWKDWLEMIDSRYTWGLFKKDFFSTDVRGREGQKDYDWKLCVPFWSIFIASLSPTLYLWVADRRRCNHKLGGCSACSYDLTGNVSGRCPECGTAIGCQGSIA